MAYDDIAKEDHSYNATREEGSRKERSRAIHPQQVRERSNQRFEGHEEDSYRRESSGWRFFCSRDIVFFPFLFVILVAKVRQLVGVELGNFIMV